jgi:PAS domain S-box-containing protein
MTARLAIPGDAATKAAEKAVRGLWGPRLLAEPFHGRGYWRSGMANVPPGLGAVSLEGRERLAAIIESSDDAILAKDLNGVILSWNRGAERIFGYKAAEAVGKHISMLIPPHLLKEEEFIMRRLRQGGRVSHFETVRRRKDGSLVDISLTISPIHDATGRVVGASKIARDITEQHRAREALADLAATLERRVAERTKALRDRGRELEGAVIALESFNYAVSHDLRTPLRAIKGFSDLLLEGTNLTIDQRRHVAYITEASTEMTRITESLLNLSRIRSDAVQRQTVDIGAIASRILARFQEEQPPRAVQVLIGDDLTTSADSALVQSLMENLIGNAWKFTAKRRRPRIEVGRALHDGVPYFYVRDNGVGFTATQAATLFRPFQRLRPDEFPGTGIGLATVRRIIAAHRGRVVAMGRPGRGATIWFRLGDAEQQGGALRREAARTRTTRTKIGAQRPPHMPKRSAAAAQIRRVPAAPTRRC